MPIVVEGRTYELISRVAKEVGIPRQTLYNACKRGLISFIVIGKQRLVDVADVQRFAHQHYRKDLAQVMKRAWRRRRKRRS